MHKLIYSLVYGKAKYVLMPVMVAVFMFAAVVAPAAAAGPVADVVPAGENVELHYPSYAVAASSYQSLTVNLDTTQLFSGAQLIIDALSSPYLLIAGLGLGVAILAAIMKAVTGLRL